MKYKDKKFQLSNAIWTRYRFNSVKNIGCMNKIFKIYYNTQKSIFESLTPDDFLKYYFTEHMSERKFKELSDRFYQRLKEAGMSVTKREVYIFCIIRVIDETFEGFKRELRMMKEIGEWYEGGDVRFSDVNDLKYAVDIEVWYGDVFLDAYQIKPISYLKGIETKKEYCLTEYEYNRQKHDEFYDLTGIKTVYLFEIDENNFLQMNYDEF